MRHNTSDVIEVKSNLVLTLRERGKIVTRRQGHNIWLNLGRQYLASLICYADYTPTFERSDRIRYIGLGIGGNRQIAPSVANASPLIDDYPGTNTQVDTDPTVTEMQRPVRLTGAGGSFPPNGAYSPSSTGNTWLGQVQAPVTHPIASQSQFKRLFTTTEISYSPPSGSYLSVPLAEAGLFTSGADPTVPPKLLRAPAYNSSFFVAYDTFDTISKTTAFELEVNWTIRF